MNISLNFCYKQSTQIHRQVRTKSIAFSHAQMLNQRFRQLSRAILVNFLFVRLFREKKKRRCKAWLRSKFWIKHLLQKQEKKLTKF